MLLHPKQLILKVIIEHQNNQVKSAEINSKEFEQKMEANPFKWKVDITISLIDAVVVLQEIHEQVMHVMLAAIEY